jgi:hypothetical protein
VSAGRGTLKRGALLAVGLFVLHAVRRGRLRDRARAIGGAHTGDEPIARVDGPVDHTREVGVPPPSVDDYDDLLDQEGAGSFPASDPSASY